MLVDLAKAIKWLSEYTNCLLLDNCSRSREYLSKAVGEFSLLLMIIKQSQLTNSMGDLDGLDRLIPTIKENIDDISKSDLEKAQILLCLSFYETDKKPKQSIIDEIVSKKEHISNNIELAYIISQCGVSLPLNYWDSQLVKVFCELLNGKESNYRKVLYDLTHVIFFATNFGCRIFPVKTACLLKTSVEILFKAVEKSILEQDWDLAIELLIALVVIQSGEIENQEMLSLTQTLLKNQRADGAFVSDGNPKGNPETISHRNAYSVYHTTAIAVILNLLIEKHLTNQIIRTQQRWAGV